MEEKQYIERLKHIRERINILVDELWDDHVNKKNLFIKVILENKLYRILYLVMKLNTKTEREINR